MRDLIHFGVDLLKVHLVRFVLERSPLAGLLLALGLLRLVLWFLSE